MVLLPLIMFSLVIAVVAILMLMSAVRLLSLKRVALKCLKLFASSSCNSIHVNLSFADAIDVNHDFAVVTAGLHSTCIGTVR